jgi:hypothetical protein
MFCDSMAWVKPAGTIKPPAARQQPVADNLSAPAGMQMSTINKDCPPLPLVGS